MFDEVYKSLKLGLRRRWRLGVTQALSVAGAIWLVTEITTKVSDPAELWIKQHADAYSAIVIFAAVVWFVSYIYETRSVSFNLPTTNTKISIRYGDLFAQPTNWLIGVGEFFDSELGQIVSNNTIHGKLIDKIYGGNGALFRTAVDEALVGVKATRTQRSVQPKLKYDIGTTAVLANGPHKIFLVAMSRTNLETSKASSDVPTLWTALSGALQAVHNFGNGAPLSLPLIGNGQSSVNIRPQHLLRLISLALVDHGRKIGLPNEVNIIVSEDCFEALDIREIRRDWRKS